MCQNDNAPAMEELLQKVAEVEKLGEEFSNTYQKVR